MSKPEDLWDAEPEPFEEGEDDEEMFEIHKEMGDKPEGLTGATQEYRDKYAEWLKNQ